MIRGIQADKDFFQKYAQNVNIYDIDVNKCFEGSTSPENRFILKQLGPVKGKSILELGCGTGEGSVYFSTKGAQCVATDSSPELVKRAFELASRYGTKIEGRVVSLPDIDFPDNSFDIVYAANVLHHTNVFQALKEIHRVLKPRGRLCFWDPLKHNPVIKVYRMMARQVRTRGESPLDINIIKQIKSMFSEVSYDAFWIASLWIFIRFFLIEKADPNKEYYWKKIIYEESRLRGSYLKLESIDNLLKKMPFMRRYAWNLAVVATK